jgi:hypothetical protein
VRARFASAGFVEGRSRSKPNGKIEFAIQDVTMVILLLLHLQFILRH